MNDLEILLKRSMPNARDLQTTTAERERLAAYSPEYAAAPRSESDTNVLSKPSNTLSSREKAEHRASFLPNQTTITPESTIIDDSLYGSDFSPLRRGDRPQKHVERENFESWKGKRLAGAPSKK
jgi:hypothetical protein